MVVISRPPFIPIASATGTLIMEMTYGTDIKSHEDKFLQASQRAMEHFESAMVPGALLVDTFPICSPPGLWPEAVVNILNPFIFLLTSVNEVVPRGWERLRSP